MRTYTPAAVPTAMSSDRQVTAFISTHAVDARRQALKRSFRQEMKRVHPDRGGSHAEFIEVVAAYERELRAA